MDLGESAKMKVAVCISGHPRAYAQGYEYLKRNILDKHDCEVFFHTWANDVYGEEEIFDLYQPAIGLYDHSMPSTQSQAKMLEKYTNTPNSKRYPPHFTVTAFQSMFYSCMFMAEWEAKHQKFDWVVRTRFDFAINGQIPFDQIGRGKLYIPNCRMVPTRDFGNDQFAFGDPITMKKYMSTFLFLDDYYAQGYQMIGEEMMKANLHNHGLIGDKLMYVDVNHPFPPGKYNGTPHSLIRDDMDKWLK